MKLLSKYKCIFKQEEYIYGSVFLSISHSNHDPYRRNLLKISEVQVKFEFFFPLTSGSSENNNCYDEVKIWMEIIPTI